MSFLCDNNMLSRSLFSVVCRQSRLQVLARQYLQCGRSPIPCSSLQSPGVPQAVKCIHVSATRCSEEEKIGKAKTKLRARKRAKQSKEEEDKKEDNEMMAAAVEAAKSLSGDWTRTADDLMNRLVMHDGKDSVKDENNAEQRTEPILATMQVGRGFERRKDDRQRQRSPELKSDYQTVSDAPFPRRRSALQRFPGHFSKVYSRPPLGIFDKKSFKEDQGEEERGLWYEHDLENIHKSKGSLPGNAFEEMIQWTKEGKMWAYPIDNEAEMHEERKYQFHEHIFLERHLGAFPSQGPLRRFMELVVTGLSNNPWLSVPEKEEHIQWFADYFREKQSLLEPSLGEQAKLKDLDA